MVLVTADTSSLASFHEAGHTIKKLGLLIHGFIGFPSVMAVPWEMTGDGHESHFQRNYLCYFLLVNVLLDAMAPGSRVVLVTSCVHTEAPAPTWIDVLFSVSSLCWGWLDLTVFVVCMRISAVLTRAEWRRIPLS
jgi:NAD(P)-dependent dehydrogenase (short-subunit alcohol dehydrogenase family)